MTEQPKSTIRTTIMHVAPFAVAACCVAFWQIGVAMTPPQPATIEEWAVQTVEKGFGYHSADADATASRGGHLAGNGWAALGDLRQEFEKARKAGILVIARPQIHKTDEARETWRVDIPVYIWGCFDLPKRENGGDQCAGGEVRANYTTLRLSILHSPVGAQKDFILESMVAQP